MRFVCFFFIYLISFPLAADKIGNVDYHLPNQAKNWKIAQERQTDRKVKSLTRVYLPENASKENAKETFIVHINNLPTHFIDQNPEMLQKAIERGSACKFSNPAVKVVLVEKFPASILYEYAISEDGQEKAHGWTRAFSNPQETILLTYQTEDREAVNQVLPIWIETLKEARVVDRENDQY